MATCDHCEYMRSVHLPDHYTTLAVRCRAEGLDDRQTDLVLAALARTDGHEYPMRGFAPWGEIALIRRTLVEAGEPRYWEGR